MQHESWNPEQFGDDLPPPLGAVYERPPQLIERLKSINDQDPAFVSWVLVRSQELAELFTKFGLTNEEDAREVIARNLVEAYDIHEALGVREQIETMLASTPNDGGDGEAQPPSAVPPGGQ